MTVHPHGCGEHDYSIVVSGKKNGSSPRVWGTFRCSKKEIKRDRFIPTGVGNMRLVRSGIIDLAVHPHGCGEHVRNQVNEWIEGGSSPRVWGTFTGLGFGSCAIRFIPTGVGNIISVARRLPESSVHPHGCGEHVNNIKTIHILIGSSPRVWGTFKGGKCRIRSDRFIPTGVGNMRG